jgi:hypothetical protein
MNDVYTYCVNNCTENMDNPLLLDESSTYCLITSQDLVVDLVKQNALLTAMIQKQTSAKN